MKKLNHQHVSVSPGVLLIAAMIASGSVLCHGAVTTGLSGDFAGWTSTGDVGTDTGGSFNGGSNPSPSGANQAIASTMNTADFSTTVAGGSAVDPASLATFLGTSSLPNAQEGSGFKQTFTLGGPGTVSFQYNFFTGEPANGSDYAFYTLYQVGNSGNSIVQLANTSSGMHSIPAGGLGPFGMNRETGYQNLTVPITGAGQWVLGFGVVDANPGQIATDSALGIAAVSVVPEPWAWSLVSALALGGLAIARRVRVSRA